MKVKGAIRWRLKVVMDKCQIGTMQLAGFMKVSKGSVSKWRQAEYLPEINEKRYIQIYNAINELCDRNGTPSRKIKPQDLIEFCVDEVRDFELLDYQYPSGSQRKKAESKVEKRSNGSTKDTIAA